MTEVKHNPLLSEVKENMKKLKRNERSLNAEGMGAVVSRIEREQESLQTNLKSNARGPEEGPEPQIV